MPDLTLPFTCRHGRQLTRADRLTTGQCAVCWPEHFGPPRSVPVYRTADEAIAAAPPKPPRPPERPADCVRLGKVIARTNRAALPVICAGQWLRVCETHGACTVNGDRGDVKNCQRCGDYHSATREDEPAPVADPPPVAFVAGEAFRFDGHTLWPGVDGMRFNASILPLPDTGYLFACRTGWAGSEILTGRLDATLRPAGEPSRLRLDHWRANYGREDPRLFLHKGQPHVSFIGVQGEGDWIVTNQMFARLSPGGGAVEDVFATEVPDRRAWEKNWSFFDHGGQLYAVYLTAPRHRVVRIDSNAATPAYDEPFPGDWQGGELRGGAAPVRVGEEFYSFTHDRVERNGRTVYRVGLYTFAASPPFAPRRWIPGPILSADDPPFAVPHDNYCDVVFPGGAVRVGGVWLLASGVHDRWCEVRALDADSLERRLVPFC